MLTKHKKIIVISALILIVALVGLAIAWSPFLIEHYNLGTSEYKCGSSNGGWAPAFMDSGELATCDGKRLSKDSPLIDSDGFTCYCHTENTCWNGQTCINHEKTPQSKCDASRGSWASVDIGASDLMACDGKRLSKDSPLVDNDGFTCYCLAENTCWDGEMCKKISR